MPHATPGSPRFRLRGSGRGAVRSWLVRHLQSFFFSLGLMARAPISTLMTAAVLGIALALPAGLYVLLDNVNRLTEHWDGGNRISVFLRPGESDDAAESLAARLREWREIEQVTVITRAQALAEYRRMSGFSEVLDAFEDVNPLPAVLNVLPAPHVQDPATMQTVLASITRLPAVDFAHFDLEWLNRLDAIVEIARRGVYLLASVLALGVVLIVGNTIRLGIENRREEIEIARLFGATNAFIRRPFLYGGLLFGVFGAGIAGVIVAAGFVVLKPAVGQLSSLYGSDYGLSGLGAGGSLVLVGVGAGLGLVGAWVAVGRHLLAGPGR